MIDHISMMRVAEKVSLKSTCPDRQVGVSIRLANGQESCVCNDAALDDTNANHAEARFVTFGSQSGWDFKDATLYTTCRPCARCTAMLLPLGLKAIYYRDAQPEMGHLQALRDAGVHIDGGWITGQVAKSWAD